MVRGEMEGQRSGCEGESVRREGGITGEEGRGMEEEEGRERYLDTYFFVILFAFTSLWFLGAIVRLPFLVVWDFERDEEDGFLELDFLGAF